jgi:hypothetical protein
MLRKIIFGHFAIGTVGCGIDGDHILNRKFEKQNEKSKPTPAKFPALPILIFPACRQAYFIFDLT